MIFKNRQAIDKNDGLLQPSFLSLAFDVHYHRKSFNEKNIVFYLWPSKMFSVCQCQEISCKALITYNVVDFCTFLRIIKACEVFYYL